MAKQLNVSLAFSADTSKAKAQIQELTQALQNVSKMPASASSLFDDVSIKKASQAAMELEQHLSKAVNVDTGKLDLSRFSSSLKASKKNLSDYSQTLLSIGPTGQQAFLSLARAIATADTPVTRINKKVAELGTTLKNTARWQLSSSVLHGFMGAVQSAYGYAQDLNESLNDIRIVTGQSVDQMKDFAVEANRAAKSLSTTTTEYTKASLIFYQQGLSDNEVQERSDITVKMAQAAGESADQVSSYMTAIWNNFDDGSKSLEYYGDVMANLGAKTAASSAEIAEGLEKFAAIGDTVGLSYEYATAAVTTIVDKTRASASTVGDALKTIFARLQGLKLGETLEDGVDLNKYSSALKAVGVEVLDLNGNLKSADSIIQELGETWGTLSSAQQTALAQTVAGTRQYTQLMALMNNFNAFEQNVGYANTSEGTLQEQADIYAESWEAAQNRVRTAAENIYDSLINDEFFIDLLNGFEKVLNTIGGLVDGLGGLKGVVGIVGSVFLTTFAQKMPETLTNLKQNLMVFTGQAEKEMQKVQATLNKDIAMAQATPGVSESYKVQLDGVRAVNEMKGKLIAVARNLTEQEKLEYEAKIRNVSAMYDEIAALTKKKEAIEETAKAAAKALAESAEANVKSLAKESNKTNKSMARHETAISDLDAEAQQLRDDALANGTDNSTRLAQIEQERAAHVTALVEIRERASELAAELDDVATSYDLTEQEVKQLVESNGQLTPDVLQKMKSATDQVTKSFTTLATQRAVAADLATAVRSQGDEWKKAGAAIKDYVSKTKNTKQAQKDIEAMKKKMADYVAEIKKLASTNKILKGHEQELDDIVASIEDMTDVDEITGAFDNFAQSIGEAADSDVTVLDERLSHVRDHMEAMQISPDVANSMEQVAESSANVSTELNNVKQNVSSISTEAPQGIFHMSTAMTQFGAAVMSASTLISSVQSAISVFTDEGATGFEKLGAAISVVTAVMATYNTLQALSTTLSKADKIAKLGAAAGQAAANAMAALGIGVKNAETGAVVANTAAWYANPIMWIALIVVAVVAAFLLLVSAISAVTNALKSMTAEEKLKSAEAEATRLAEELDKAKTAADNLRSSIENYDTAVDKIKTLTEGTEEWRQSIEEANDAARKLIDEYGEELAGKYHFNAETGLIEFDKGALDDLQKIVDDNVKTVQAQKLMADNGVITAKQNVINKGVAKENDISIAKGALSGAVLAPALTPIITSILPAAYAAQAVTNKAQMDALSKLQEAYYDSNGNMVDAVNSLDPITSNLISSLGYTDTKLEELCAASRANTQALIENNKQIVDSQFGDNKEYQNSENKAFLNEILAEDLADVTDDIYNSTYKGMDKKAAAQQYAELMGYDTDAITVKKGKATFLDNEGNEINVSVNQLKTYLAQEDALAQLNNQMSDYVDKVEELEDAEKSLAAAYADGKINYEQYSKQIEQVGKQLGLSKREIDSYLSKYASENMVRAGNEDRLAKNIADMGYDSGEAQKFMESFAKDLTDEQLQLAINVSATAESIDEFKREFQHAATDALISSFESTSNQIETMLAEADEKGSFSRDDFAALEQNDQFMAWMEEQKISMIELTHGNYTEQYNIISAFYSDLRQLQQEAYTQSIDNYQNDLAEYQAILDYKLAAEEDNQSEMNAIREAWGNSIDFEAYMEMDISDVQDKLDEATRMIEEVTNKKYELDLSWDGIDQLEGSFDELGNFASMMENDVKKVGNSYQMTAAQGKKWMQMYPELFKTADITTDGLISLTEEEYQAFSAAQKEKRDEAIEAEIQTLEARLVELDAEEQALLRQKELYTTLAEGEVNLENAKAEDLVAMRQNLTQFYIDSGLDEAEANRLALQDMGLSQEQYNDLVADSSEDNASNLINSTMTGVQKVKTLFSNLVSNLSGVFSNLGAAIGALFTGNWQAIGGYISAAWSSAQGAVSGVVNDFRAARDNTMGNFKIDGQYTKYESQAKYEEAKTKHLADTIANLDEKLATIGDSRDTINTQILYLKALKNQDLSEYNSTDPDDVDETNKDKDKTEEEKEKEIKEMLEDAERYHEITREIEAMERALDRLGKQKERAFGADKLALMDEELEAMEALYAKEQELLNAQQVFLASDLANIEDAFTTDVKRDENGNISNYSDLVAEAQGDLNTARETYNNSAQEDADKDALDEAEKLYEERIAYLEQYEETLDGVNDQIDKMEEQLYAMQDKNYEKFNYKMELQLEISESDLELLDYYLGKIADDFSQAEEAAKLMVGTMKDLEGGQFGGKMGQYQSNLEAAKERQNELNNLFKAGKISEEQYREGLDAVKEQYLENIQAMQELDKEMMEYYGNTLAKAQEELSKYTSQMEHQTSVLEHYKSLINLMGKSNDYAMIGKVLEGQVETTKNSAEISKTWYDSRRADADRLKQEYEDAKKSNATAEELELLEQKWQDAEVAANEAQEQMLSDAEAWAEALKAVLENRLAELGQTLENSLTGEWGSFDAMTTAMERANSLQEDYLTTTNQIYETNKLMRTAQQEIDKTTNSVAKKRLASYIEETQQLQNKNKLSQYELDIQQAKYDLLMAEIALEEAQASKSTVRLQRDNEGNFGYVYTADSNAISDAQQKLEDAQNKLYNIGLDGANEYAEKYQATMAEMYDTLGSLQEQYLNGAFESEEEYNTAMENAKAFYYQKLQDYSSLYSVALTTDSRVVSEAWSTDFSSMIYDTEKWMGKVDEYVDGTSDAFKDWQSAVTGPGGVTSIIGSSVEEVGSKVGTVTAKSEELATTTRDTVIPALNDEITSVDNLTGAYARMRDTITSAIGEYERLIESINDGKRNAAGGDDTEETPSTTPPSDTTPTTTTPNPSTQDNNTTPKSTPKTENEEETVTWDRVMSAYQHIINGDWGTGVDNRVANGKKANYTEKEVRLAQDYINYTFPVEQRGQGKSPEEAKALMGFDTGGYTGEWNGAYGKLAVLHQKELVLNAADTQNLLASVEVLNEILRMIDLQSISSQVGGLLSSPAFGNIGNQTVEQSVTIEASFPAVQDRNEIEAAFDNLINRASQYANRK